MLPRGELPSPGPCAENLSPARRDALAKARAFVEALGKASSVHGDGAIELRRTMKRLCPQLFEACMERMVRGRPR